jgi:hypothetical protein
MKPQFPSEMREAAILASIIYEENSLRVLPLHCGMILPLLEKEVEEALRVIRKRIDQTRTDSINKDFEDFED